MGLAHVALAWRQVATTVADDRGPARGNKSQKKGCAGRDSNPRASVVLHGVQPLGHCCFVVWIGCALAFEVELVRERLTEETEERQRPTGTNTPGTAARCCCCSERRAECVRGRVLAEGKEKGGWEVLTAVGVDAKGGAGEATQY